MLSLPLSLIVIVAGILIGGVGIGGVLLVPALKYLADIPLHTAIPACMMAYILTGGIGAYIFARHGSINWALGKSVCIGAIPGGLLGALLLPYISAPILELLIALLLVATGLDSLRKKHQSEASGMPDAGIRYVLIGFIIGVGSALTGTGGPLLLVPTLIWLGVPVLTTIGLSQAIQIPISIMSTAGNYAVGELDLILGLVLGVLLSIGALVGARSAHLLPVDTLRKLVSWLLVAVGLSMLYKLAF